MPIMKEPSRLLESVVALAKEAGRAILAIYDSEFSVTQKSDQSPLTAADLASHELIVAGLARLRPQFPVLSEESAAHAFEDRKNWSSLWLVDPLDGTKEFVKRNGEFTVNIALIHEHAPVLGVVHAPALDLTYFAAEGCGAFRQHGDQTPQRIRVRAQAPLHPVVVGSRSHVNAAMETYLNRLGECELRPMGSSLKLCLVAEGTADLYPRIGPTSEWDTAAAHCVVTEAGGAVTDLTGAPLVYNARDSLLNPYFLVFGDKSRPWLDYTRGIEG
ncbi:3'(2'),5'-bisphosphate nucleotidase CysQ [Methylococcus capsulatus]|jgi:3'(2'), 5'-bisphosphate nucleotidase|uniref:3'(2'),5'-bisphosphate nucleotidase CysQ n=1 Tax=Methylococcus capsulatus TaxID=414 RepID=UPI002017B2FF|nr:3'(2'),5'-bisphosphate nucleotidase CysQ [Methylococcus capsulatus]UQN11576.1 3'(2'),5'-bisphosphate nucleotidase CysQ [Methylococcus capsulatus]